MKHRPIRRSRVAPAVKGLLCVCSLLLSLAAGARAQSLPKTSDISEDVSPDGSVDLGFQMTFEAASWRQWKAMVGDEPARLRALMRHQFAAMTLENFKLERDDLNRVAKLSMHSPVGPDLREDASYQLPVDGSFRLVNGAARSWYFSGNNPSAGNSLTNIRVTLPANAVNPYVVNPNTAEQALVFALTPAPSGSRWLYLLGALFLLAGAAALVGGFVIRTNRVELLPPATTRALPGAASMIGRASVIATPPAPAPVIAPPPMPPAGPPPIPPPSAGAPRGSQVNPPQYGQIYNDPD